MSKSQPISVSGECRGCEREIVQLIPFRDGTALGDDHIRVRCAECRKTNSLDKHRPEP